MRGASGILSIQAILGFYDTIPAITETSNPSAPQNLPQPHQERCWKREQGLSRVARAGKMLEKDGWHQEKDGRKRRMAGREGWQLEKDGMMEKEGMMKDGRWRRMELWRRMG